MKLPANLSTLTKVAIASFGAAAAGAAYITFVEPNWLSATHHDIGIRDLPSTLDGLVIAQLSDLHVTRDMGSCSAVAQAIRMCRDRSPDLILLTGDFVGERKAVDRFAEMISDLRGLTTFAVLGNHEYQHGPTHRRRVVQVLEDAGVQLLSNRAAPFERAGSRLWIVGVDDAYTGRDHLDQALDNLGPGDRPRILLSHYPDLIHHRRAKEVDLALAGHTHGGQINLPMFNASTLAHADSRYLCGMFCIDGVPLYVSRGLGTSGYRVRLRARPEIAFFTLRRFPSD